MTEPLGETHSSDKSVRKYDVVSFYARDKFIGYWVGKLFQLFCGRGGNFQELGHPPHFGFFWLASERSWCLWVCHLTDVLQWMYQFNSVQSLSCVQLFVTPWTAVWQVSLSITNSWSLLKLMSTKSVMPSNHLILCHPLLFLPSSFPSISVFSNELVLSIRWPNYWSLSFSISPSNEYLGLISFRND